MDALVSRTKTTNISQLRRDGMTRLLCSLSPSLAASSYFFFVLQLITVDASVCKKQNKQKKIKRLKKTVFLALLPHIV
jgi:hypothetical protein